MPDRIKDRIHLVEIVPEVYKGNRGWRVVMGYSVTDEEPMLQVTWHLSKKEHLEENLIRITRNWMHCLCAAIGESTVDWKLSDEDFQALKRPQSTPQS